MTPAPEVAVSYFFEASAGTGKTTRLIEQIVHCVASGTRLERIVAVTFTHAAAGEMKLRLREELGRAGQSAADLELAFVGTIHSFCARLLRERPVEAGVDPRFEELAEEEASALFAMVFRRWVEIHLSEPNPVLRRALTRLTWRDDGEGRDPLASLRNAAWTLIDWRDHPATWSRRPFESHRRSRLNHRRSARGNEHATRRPSGRLAGQGTLPSRGVHRASRSRAGQRHARRRHARK